MSFIKNITESLMSGNVFAARKAFNNLVMEAVPAVKPNLRDVKELLSSDPNAVVKNFLESQDGQSLLGYAGDDANVGIDHFVKYISEVTGVHGNMFKNWNSLKDIVSFYNENVASMIELPEVKDPKQYWTHFQMDVIPTDDVSDQDHVMPNIAADAVSQGQRDDLVGQGGDADSIGNVSSDARGSISSAEQDTHVSNRNLGADTDLTKNVDHTAITGAKRAQNVGVTPDSREEHRDSMASSRNAKYGDEGINSKKGTNVSGSRSFSSRQNDGGGRVSNKNSSSEAEWANKFNSLKLSKKLPAGVKNPSDLEAWFKKNGQ